MRFDSACNICGSRQFRPFAERSDGIPVIVCMTCGHGIVETFADDVQALYGDEYFAAGMDSGSGYSDYEYTAEHGVAWAAALTPLLRPSGRVLDIGCADGHLLKKLDGGYERFGIEPNQRAAGACRAAGIPVIASDLFDGALLKNHAASFDVVLAIAVFEHFADFRGAFEAALGLLGPEGILIFEVPVLSEPEPDPSDFWLRTSLEHIHYPTVQSLQYLFREPLRLAWAGKKIVIRNFASTCIGVTSKSSATMQRLTPLIERCLSAGTEHLSPAEGRFRWLLDLIHAGNTDPGVLALARCICPADMNPAIIRRLFALWTVDATRAASIERYLHDVEDARDWHAGESRKRDDIIDQQNRRLSEMEAILQPAPATPPGPTE